MIALLSLLVVLSVSLAIMRVGTAALVRTGVSEESARFQALSAFLGVGFTTRESEHVLRHPVRRRIVMLLMLLGNAGVVATVSGVVLVFATASGPIGILPRVLGLVAGVAALWLLSSSRWVDRFLARVVDWALRRWTDLEIRDYVSLLHLSGEYDVIELEVRREDWLAGRTLAELNLRAEGVLILGIGRADGTWIGVPRGPTRILADDLLVAYGRAALLEELDHRPAGATGDQAHVAAVERQHLVMEPHGPRVPAAVAPPAASSPSSPTVADP